MKVTIFFSKGRDFRAQCIQAHIPKNIKTELVNIDSLQGSLFSRLLGAVVHLWPFWHKNYIVLIISADMLGFSSLLVKYAYGLRSRIIVDFYDIFGLRKNRSNDKIMTSYRNNEISIFQNAEMFLARSFELNQYRRRFSTDNKKFLFLPDFYPLKEDNSIKSQKFPSNRIVFLGNFSMEYMLKLDRLGKDFIVDVYLWHGLDPVQLQKQCQDIQVRVNFYQSIPIERFDEVLSQYCFGIILLSETSNVYHYSAAIKYMSYLKAGINIITDPRHRISRWYARYFKERFYLVDDRNLDSVSVKSLSEFIDQQRILDGKRNSIKTQAVSDRLTKKMDVFLNG